MHRVYYISQGNTPEEHVHHISRACEAGCRLIQLRLKGVSWETQLATAQAAKKVCNSFQSLLIINDSVKLGMAIDAAGIHLGKEDMPPEEAREVLPPHMLLGGTANTLEDCLSLASKQVDYIGLGPLRFTSTKERLSPILGLEGYKRIRKALEEQAIDIPVYAIGGLAEADFDALIQTGVSGFAVSGLLTGKTTEQSKRIIESGNSKKNSNFRLQRYERKL